ncbi:outer membrane protein transport protein [Vibrio lamellibrachiae]|uniref:OmpP1/FadL family transporter n=1 Tax=Vibrio lamellibrachiae TaxID=2910253 RepID=UPI003D0C3719
MKKQSLSLTAITLAVISSYSHSAATLVSEMSHLHVSTAGAGTAAIAESASTAYSNPAAMAYLESRSLSINLAMMDLTVRYDDNRSDALSSANAGGLQPYGSLYYVEPVNDSIALGVALTSTGGSALDYGSQYAGSLALNDLQLTVMQLNPSLSYELSDKMNIGVGVQIDHATFEQTALANQATLNSDSVAFGYNLGMTYQLNDEHRLGMTFRSKMEHQLQGDLQLGSHSSEAEVTLVNAARLEISGLHQLNDPTSLVWSVGQEYWSQNKETLIDIGQTAVSKNRSFDDVWFASLGARYEVSKELRLEAGVGYVSSPLDEPTLQSPDLPVAEQKKYSLGVTYQWSDATTLNAYYSYVDYGSPEIDSGLMNGAFNNSNQFFGIEIGYRF